MDATPATCPTALDLTFLGACSFAVPMRERATTIVQVGVGGTGSWLAPHLARLVIDLGPRASLMLVDPDRVEQKNVIRQNFAPAEVGRNKARTMAERLTCATGAAVSALASPFAASMVDRWVSALPMPLVLVGCVDNAVARREMHAALHTQRDGAVWWLDCGNDNQGGQVLVGNATTTPKAHLAFPFLNRCMRWFAPSLVGPNLLDERPEDKASVEPDGLSCAERELLNRQAKTVNLTCATIAAAMLEQLLLTQSLKAYRVEFDLPSLTTRASYVTRDAFARLAAGVGQRAVRPTAPL